MLCRHSSVKYEGLWPWTAARGRWKHYIDSQCKQVEDGDPMWHRAEAPTRRGRWFDWRIAEMDAFISFFNSLQDLL